MGRVRSVGRGYHPAIENVKHLVCNMLAAALDSLCTTRSYHCRLWLPSQLASFLRHPEGRVSSERSPQVTAPEVAKDES